jgi:hypothetical protein
MKVLIKRELGSRGMLKKTTTFRLHVRAELTPEEADLVKRCEAGGTVLYSWALGKKRDISVHTTVNNIVNGAEIDCEDFIDLIDAEESMTKACAGFRNLLEKAKTFGEEVVLEF